MSNFTISNSVNYQDTSGNVKNLATEIDKTGTLTNLTTTDKSSIVNAVNENVNKIGVLSNLNTATKTDLVSAINNNVSSLANNTTHRTEWLNVKQPPYNAPTNGSSDDAIAIQQAINDVEEGGTVYIPKTSIPYFLKTAIVKDSKSFTLLIEGTLKDGVTTWTENFNDTTLNGKGLLSFGHGNISIKGSAGNSLDGNTGTAALKKFIYLFECPNVFISNVNGLNHTGSAVVGVGCTNVIHKDSSYDKGQYTVHYSRGKTYRLSDVQVTNAVYNAINVTNRGFFNSSVYAYVRPSNVKIKDCYSFSVTAPNAYAVGITADSCDNITISGNTSDGNGVGTMAYSFAGSKGGQVYGNRALNMNNTSNGTVTYAGIGMEFDTVSDIKAFGNTFNNVLVGHIIANAQRCEFDGVHTSTLTGSSGAGQSCMYQLSNTTNQSQDITLNGTVNGSDRAVSGSTLISGLVIGKMIARNTVSRTIGLFGGTITDFTINDLTVLFDGQSQQVINISADCVKDMTINKLRARAGSIQTAKQGIYSSSTGAKLFIRHAYFENFDIGIQANAVVHNQIVLNEVDYVNVNTIEQLNATNTARANVRNNGIAA